MTERRALRWAVVPLTLLVLGTGAGCAFNKTIINRKVQALDPARIRVGESTILDVVSLLGVPPPRSNQEIGTLVYSRDYLRYTTVERRCFVLGPPTWLIMPFTWCYQDDVYELAIEFEDLVVTSVHTVERDMIWRPFSDEYDLGPVRTRDLTEAHAR